MAEIAPFPGIHYDPARVPLKEVIAPPYDVLSPQEQEALYARHPANIVRLILNREAPGDNDMDNRYTRASAFLQRCLADGVFVQDPTPALYEYIQRFTHPLEPGRTVERRTLFVALRLEPYEKGIVLPHEETHPKAKADRLELMRATRSNPEPIYGLYEDPEQAVATALEAARSADSPLLHAKLPDGDEHRLYRHTDGRLLADLAAFFAPRRVWIADGHHRYETALNYQRERRAADGNPDSPQPYDYLLVGLSAFEEPGLVVLPTHRLVRNLSRERMETLTLQLQRYFYVQMMQTDSARAWLKQEAPDQKRIVVVTPRSALALTLRDFSVVDAALDASHSAAWRHLDVTILQALILDRSLGITWSELAHTTDVAYTRDEEEAVRKVQSGEYQLACLLQNPTVAEVRDVAAAGDKMPQKSTYFYPKLWSGLVLRSLE